MENSGIGSVGGAIDHPAHYGGEDNPYEVIKVIEAWNLGFRLGNTVKYIGRPDKGDYLEDLKKARWYLDREIAAREAIDPEDRISISTLQDGQMRQVRVLRPFTVRNVVHNLAGETWLTDEQGRVWMQPPDDKLWYRYPEQEA